jgi:hypothetical protein
MARKSYYFDHANTKRTREFTLCCWEYSIKIIEPLGSIPNEPIRPLLESRPTPPNPATSKC